MTNDAAVAVEEETEAEADVLAEIELGDSTYLLLKTPDGKYVVSEIDNMKSEDDGLVATSAFDDENAGIRMFCALLCSDQPDLTKEAVEMGEQGFGVA